MSESDAKELTTVEEQIPKRYKWHGNKKQRDFMENWLDPGSKTYGNMYKSALKAGFAHHYARNLTGHTPKWLQEYLDRVDLKPEHIKAGITDIATNPIAYNNSRSPADTRLKAYEILAKVEGMIDKPGGASFTFVQPILGGKSMNKPTKATHDDAIEGETVPTPDELIPTD